jgi:hypothetical protein
MCLPPSLHRPPTERTAASGDTADTALQPAVPERPAALVDAELRRAETPLRPTADLQPAG